MKKIIFVRHGKAEDQGPEFSDFERSLTVKGKLISRKMAVKLKEKENDLGIIVTSPAFRAYETAAIFNEVFRMHAEKIIIDSNLYFKTEKNSFFDILKGIPEEADIITLFGHNPSISELPDSFCSEGIDVLPKSGIISLSFKTKTWSAVGHNSGNIDYFLKPKKTI